MSFFLQVLFVSVVGVTCDHRIPGVLPTDCGTVREDYIITSVPSLDEFPWMALIAYNTGNTTKFKCTGTIISDQYILTSARCAQNIAYVRVGEYDLSAQLDCIGDDFTGLYCHNNTQDFKVAEKNTNINNDVTLLRLQKKIDFSFDNIGPICLPTSTELRNTPIHKQRGRIVVWGIDKTNGTSMRKFNVWLTALEECHSKCNRYHLTDDKDALDIAYCVRKEDSYNADIGGPLLFKNSNGNRYAQYGVASAETAECVFYTNVTKYINWILENIREY